MQQYVALFIGDDGNLGKTIGPIEGWDAAVEQALLIVEEQQATLDAKELEYLKENGTARIPGGDVHIGGLESVD